MADFLSSIFGAKPEVAGFENIDLTEEQKKALQGNIQNWDQISALGDLYQTYMLDQYQGAGLDLKSLISGGGANVSQMEGLATQFLHGEIPQDVQDQIRRQSALTALLSGGPGGANALTARDLGRTSLDLINQGANLANSAGNAAQRWANIANGVIMSPAGFVTTPAQQAQMDLTNRLIQRQVQQEKYNVAAAPDPFLQALNQWVQQVGGTVVASYLGGGMGKGGSADYKTSYNADQYLGSTGSASPDLGYSKDTGNPYVSGGGGDNSWSMSPTPGPVTGFDYGVGYPASDPSQYYTPPPIMGSNFATGYPSGSAYPFDMYGTTAFYDL